MEEAQIVHGTVAVGFDHGGKEFRVELLDLNGPRLKGGEIGDFGGGSLEPPRQWLGAQWAGLLLRAPSCPEPPGAP